MRALTLIFMGIVATSPALAGNRAVWVDTGLMLDWSGRDIASTDGSEPKYFLGNGVLCSPSNIGRVAVCWTTRAEGYPPGVPSEIIGSPPKWCTYKNETITLQVPADGSAPKGKIYVCGSPVTPVQ